MKRGFAVLGVLGVLAFAAACGGDDSGGDEASGTDDTTETPDTNDEQAAPTGEEIVVGGVAQLEFYPGIDVGVEARFERANREGGVDGRPLRFLGVRDDGSSADTNLTEVRSLAQNEDVFAVLPIASAVFLPQSSDFLSQQGVPYFGWGFMPGFCGSEWGFGFNGCLSNYDVAVTSLSEPVMEAAGLDPEGATVAIQAGDDESGQLGQAAFAAAFEEIGAEVVYNEANLPVAGGTTDYTPFVQAVLESDPDVVVLSLDFPGTIGMAGSLNAAGYDGVVESFVAYVPGLLDAQPDVAAALEGTYVNVQIPPQEDGTPAIEQIQEDLEAIGEEPFVNFGAAVGYWQADLFIAALSAAEEPTPEALSALMSEGFTYEGPEGYLDQLEFPTALTDPAPCSALVKVEGGEYQSSVPFDCYEVVPLG